MQADRQRIKHALVSADKSLRDLCERLGLSDGAVHRRMRGKTPWRAIEVEVLAAWLKVSEAWLCGE